MLTSSSPWPEIRDWRKRTRTELLERRMASDARERNSQGEQAKARLVSAFDLSRWKILGIYWPFRGEIDVRDLARAHVEAGLCAALPVVIEKGAPLEFWEWRPGMKLDRGIWNIPIPSERRVVQPDVLIVPPVAFDGGCFRLGYGGGFYDRTIAAFEAKPFCIGLGYESFRLASIFPQAHDLPMDVVVTEENVLSRPARSEG